MNSPPRSASIAPGSAALGPAERATFERDGLLVLRAWSPPELVAAAREAAVHQLDTRQPPLELEAEVGYPGAPASTSTPGGQTVRRLLRAHDRGEAFRALATSPALGQVLRELMLPADGNGSVLMAQAHHNCVMTKMPSYSSQTNWHQDVRYWSYQRPELISAWFALGSETDENGCLSFIPGTHRMNFGRDRLDDQLLRDVGVDPQDAGSGRPGAVPLPAVPRRRAKPHAGDEVLAGVYLSGRGQPAVARDEVGLDAGRGRLVRRCGPPFPPAPASRPGGSPRAALVPPPAPRSA